MRISCCEQCCSFSRCAKFMRIVATFSYSAHISRLSSQASIIIGGKRGVGGPIEAVGLWLPVASLVTYQHSTDNMCWHSFHGSSPRPSPLLSIARHHFLFRASNTWSMFYVIVLGEQRQMVFTNFVLLLPIDPKKPNDQRILRLCWLPRVHSGISET